ncbi:zf-HC2 domain-containing protein [Alkalicoccus daliensis]|uniref:Anti-sigma-W factor RsiW n=1 Tax=Alkalicoccus daliensis TaxID=745820 RepID=A0A1H0ESM8_9BACI|nr:zf-HC2 domain-containing protein [Alkalicoccus daliensis]SDN85360.1 Transmembrane transcriptional regulator (anti-sigma factor RsiW) [Alkalicoccus daliensis]
MACSREKQTLINQYMDEEMTLQETKQFEEHVNSCAECKQHVTELKKTIAIVQSASHFEAPASLTANVMNKLPKQPKTKKWQMWMRKNPMIITAATFFLIFLVSLSAAFGGEDEIVVRGEGHFIINESERIVIVPEGSSISGDLLIRNGDVEVNGEVEGDVTVINGEHLQASTAQISGDIEEINEAFEWIWYELKNFFTKVIPLGNNDGSEE